MSIIIWVVLLIICMISGYGFFELKLLRVKRYRIDDPAVPDSLKGKRIALLSDLHGIYHGKNNVRLFKKLKEEKPDYIVLSGDMINGRNDDEIKYAFRMIKKLKKFNVPVIYTFGNHEEKLRDIDLKSYRRLKRFAKKNIILLNNRAYCPDENRKVAFVGLDLPLWMYHGHDGNGLIKRRTDLIVKKASVKDCYKILIAHDPEHIDKYAKSGYNVCLSGHIHGGIVYIPFIGGIVTPRFQMLYKRAKGCHKYENMTMIVSGGVGWHDIPLRLLNHPEIVMIEF